MSGASFPNPIPIADVMKTRRWRSWAALILAGLAVSLAASAWTWREDILRTALDPKEPYQTYKPPPAPDYTQPAAWALLPGPPGAGAEAADIFFVHPTTYNGGKEWNAPVGHRDADRVLFRDMLPNHAGPYQRLGRVFAPRYRQASLYTQLTLRDDARDARRFAYRDVQAAFRVFRDRHNGGRPFMVVGVGQGGSLAARLLAEEVAPDPALRARFVVAHLIETVTPPIADLPACAAPGRPGCVAAWTSIADSDDPRRTLERALVWNGDSLEGLNGRVPLCFNPVLGATTDAAAPSSAGAANASGLEWGARPAFLRQQVAAQCRDGVLRVSRPSSEALRRSGGWAERLRAPAFNLFYADLEADAAIRLAAFLAEPTPRPARSRRASRTAPPTAAAPARARS